tara:strand:+ start:27759 stop:30047 length:2289 start_codon:yes stop_codon:yes gene_type:complete
MRILFTCMKILCLPQSRPVGSEKRSCWIQEGISRPSPTLTVKQLGMAGPPEAARYADDIRSAGHVMEEVFRRKPYLQFLRGKSSPDYSLIEARDGSMIPARGGKALCSSYGPEKEARRILSGSQGLKRTQILVILGAGNPEIFRATESLVPGQICAVLDHRLDLGGFYIQTLMNDSRPEKVARDESPHSPGQSDASADGTGKGSESGDLNPDPTLPDSIIEESHPQGHAAKVRSDTAQTAGSRLIPQSESPDRSPSPGPALPAFQSYLNTPGCHVFFGEETLVSLEHYLEGLPAENFQGIRFLKHRASVDQAPEFYEFAEARMRGILQSRMSDLLTRFEFEPLWLRNTLINSKHASSHHEPENLIYWQDRWKDRPALLISAGPGLTESLDWIARYQHQFFILACDTALKPLLRAGIRPHGIHILDAQKQTLLHFLNEDLSDMVIFADLVCHPALPLHLAPAGWVFSSTARLIYRPDGSTEELKTPGTDLLESMCGAQGKLQSGGSVATSAFDLLRFLGFRTIYFAGQDLAWTFRQLHALNTHHYERWNFMVSRTLSLETINERVMQKRDLVPVPSVDGKSIPGDFILSLYRSWFEQSIESLKHEDPVKCINLSRSGSQIEGMQNLRIENPDALPEMAKNPAMTATDSTSAANASRVTNGTNAELRTELLEAFKDARKRDESNTPLLQSIYQSLLDLLYGEATATEAEVVWQRYPELRALIRRTEVYISRNQEKLSEERASSVYRTNLKKSLTQFLRFINRYI